MHALAALLLSAGTALAADPAEAPADDAPAEEEGPVTYTLDPAQSHLYVIVYNDTSSLMSRLGHDHAIRASTFTGTVVWDTEDPSACAVDIHFPVTALVPDPPGMRQRAGLDPEGAVNESSLKKIQNNFLSAGQLDSSSFPTISYKATSCDGVQGTVNVTGALTIRGASKTLTTPMTIELGEDTFSASGSFKAMHTDFGFKPFSNLGGALRNQDQLKFVIEVKGSR